ncbi:SPX domain-containing protein 2 isoform X2 [Gossypium raimondii]|uniref:SPX domain-containing protein n=1 Tax=Gossypium raimondii TaxID=29730 RepID=A0A0D2V8V3_GOSRA|nr:SPX domain-containing protein 2 isoform X2 [Gossypium raimondii]KJB65820.1 hypothetical protein B456_010G114600 [Gossypium raimondii]
MKWRNSIPFSLRKKRIMLSNGGRMQVELAALDAWLLWHFRQISFSLQRVLLLSPCDLQELQDRAEKAKASDGGLMNVGREIVDFHGEMVLLENYSALNYTGLVKIIKKYDKRSGALVRLPFIQKVLQQPFYRTDVLNELVKECEMVLDRLFSTNEPSALPDVTNEKDHKPDTSSRSNENLLKVPKELAEIKDMENMYMKQTLSALHVLKEIRSGSSTVSVFSLPPLQNRALDDQKKITVLEQAAK